jgi:PPOX class probable F420-dependent enzyme
MAFKNWEEAKNLIEGKNFANLATLMPDGSPQVTPVWIDLDGEAIAVNTSEGRVKLGNVLRDPRVALSIYDQENPYRKVVIRGKVVEVTKEGAEDHIDKMSMKYRGIPKYPYRQPGVSRVLIRIKPFAVSL